MRVLPALLAGAIFGAPPAMADSRAASIVPFKAAIVPLVAGTYSANCLRIVDHEPAGTGQGVPISIQAGGTVSWGGHAVDIVHSTATRVGLVVSHQPDDRSVGAGLELVDDQGARTTIFSVTVLADGSMAGATATDETLRPSQGSGCSSAALPAAVGADLWQLAARFIHFEQLAVACVQLVPFRQDRRAFTFTDRAILLGDLRLGAGEVRASEHVEARDAGEYAFGYALARPDKGVLDVSIGADRSLHGVRWTAADGTTTSCALPK